MASTTALFTGLSGLAANSRNLDVIGNNIANVNTTAFKSNRLLFASQFSRTFSIGTVPGEVNGGTNPGQIGLGVTVAGTQRDFSGGAISPTGDARDLAIEGDGFFVVSRGGTPYYTRAGAFRQNSANDLVTISGERVMGYGVDDDFNIVQGDLAPLSIPVGSMSLLEPTRNVRFSGVLNTDGAVPTRGSRHDFNGLGLLGSGVAGGISPATPLATLENPLAPGTAVFAPGQTFRVEGAQRGTKSVPTADLPITAATTMQDLIDFLNGALGINTDAGNNPDGRTPGVSLDNASGSLTVIGNAGAANSLALVTSDLQVLNADGTRSGTPFSPDLVETADGESVRTTFVAFDSLGTPISVDLTLVMDSKTVNGTTWRYFVDSGEDSRLTTAIGTGTISFDTAGRLVGNPTFGVTIERANTGAGTPLAFDIAFDSAGSTVRAANGARSDIASVYQDGAPLGTLASYSVGQDGTITGAFTNGLTRTVGQVALATFSNPEGLVDIGSNLFTPGPNSGTPVVGPPGTLGSGRIVGGALELSNVDLSQEFINLILASTGYSAASRVITTTDQLMQQLLVLGR